MPVCPASGGMKADVLSDELTRRRLRLRCHSWSAARPLSRPCRSSWDSKRNLIPRSRMLANTASASTDDSDGSSQKRGGRVPVAMWPVCCMDEAAPTDSNPTGLVRRPHAPGIRSLSHESWTSGVIWRTAEGPSRGCGLHPGGARDDCGPFGAWRQRTRARGTTAASRRHRARALGSTRPDGCNP